MELRKEFGINAIEGSLSAMGVAYSRQGDNQDNHLLYRFMSLRNIEPGGIFYVADTIKELPKFQSSIIVCSPVLVVGDTPNIVIRVEEPQLVFYRLMESLVGNGKRPLGIHPTAIVGEDCQIDESAYIGPYCVLESCRVGAGVNLHSHVTVMSGSVIDDNVTIESYSVIGATGVAWIWDTKARRRVMQPQIGYTYIGRDVFLGSDVTVVRGSVNETTRIGEGSVIAHGSKIGHGSQIGSECHFANNVSIAGNAVLGSQCFLGSGAIVRPQAKLAEGTIVGAGAVVVKNCDTPNQLLVGNPAKVAEKKALTGVPKPLNDQ